MASKPYKTTVQQQESSLAVRATLTTHRQQIAGGARELYESVLREGETMFDWDLYQELNLRLMEEACKQLVEADLTERAEAADTTASREALSAQANEVRRHIRRVKSDFVWSYGADALEPFGLNGGLARKPLNLLAQGRYIVVKLRDPEVPLPDPLADDRALERESLAGALESDLDRLDDVHTEVEQESKQTQEARITWRAALDTHRRRHGNLTRVFVADLRLLGLDELADRVRLTIARRPAKADAADADNGEDGAATDGVSGDSSENADVAEESTEPVSAPATESP